MMQETGYHDSSGIPIHFGDLIRVKHYRHYRGRRQMWIYFRVAKIDGVAVVQNWSDLDPSRHQTCLKYLECENIEVLAETLSLIHI